MKRLRGNLTFANAIAAVALFVALGGSAYAATQLPANSVGTKQLKKEAVTPAKLSAAAKATMTGPAGPKGAIGPQGDNGPAGLVGPAGSAETNGPSPIDASVPASPITEATSMLALTGRTSWTAPEEPAGLLVAQLKVKLAKQNGQQQEICQPRVEIFDNGELVTSIEVGLPFFGSEQGTFKDYEQTTAPIGIGLVDHTATHAITAQYVGTNTINCAEGSEFEGLRIIVQPLG